MFGKIKEFFSGKAALAVEGAADEKDLQLATAVLLLNMAGADEDYAPEEVQAVFRVMQKQFGLEENEAMELLEIADSARLEKQKVDEFVKVINDNFSQKQKQQVLSMIWCVVHADGKVDKFEQRYATQMKFRLQLTDEQAEAAKKAAESGKM